MGLRNRFFDVFFLSHAAVTLTIFLVLSFIMSNNLGDVLVDMQVELQLQSLSQIRSYSDGKFDTVLSTLQQAYISYNDSAATLFRFLMEPETTGGEYILLRSTVDRYFRSFVFPRDRDLCCIALCRAHDASVDVFYRDVSGVPKRDLQERALDAQTDISDTYRICVFPSVEHLAGYSGRMQLYALGTTIRSLPDFRHIGSILFFFHSQGLPSILRDHQISMDGHYVALSQKGEVLFEHPDFLGGSSQDWHSWYDVSDVRVMRKARIRGKESLIISLKSDRGTTLISVLERRAVFASINAARYFMFAVMLAGIGVAILFSYVTSKRFSHRLRSLTEAIGSIGNGELSHRIQTGKREDEIEQISRHFNRMCDLLVANMHRNIALEVDRRHAQLMALRNRINPHFLYNTLESIHMAALANGDEDVAYMILALASVYRRIVKQTESVHSLDEELELCRSVMEVYQYRYGDDLQIEYHVDRGLGRYGVLSFTLQSLLDNAVNHGMCNGQPIRISVTAFGSADHLTLQVSDNGAGIEPQLLAKLNARLKTACRREARDPSTEQIDLMALSERLWLVFEDQAGVSVESEMAVGTTVSLRFPKTPVEEMRRRVQGSVGR